HYIELAESIPQIVWTADRSGKINYFNRRWHEYTGCEVLGQEGPDGLISMLHPSDREALAQRWQKSIADGLRFDFECRLRRAADDCYRWHLCRAVPETDGEGNHVGWVGTLTEIDQQKRTEVAQRFIAGASRLLAESLDYR